MDCSAWLQLETQLWCLELDGDAMRPMVDNSLWHNRWGRRVVIDHFQPIRVHSGIFRPQGRPCSPFRQL